jgi:hypothetical protein
MSATALAPHSDFSKWEPLRRLRYGAMIRLFRHRWGHALPEDDAGHGDLWPLVLNVSLAAAEPLKRSYARFAATSGRATPVSLNQWSCLG